MNKTSKNKYELFPTLMMEIGKNGDTIKSLAKKINITPVTLARRLNGSRPFELPEVVKIIELYQKSFDELFLKDYKKKEG